MPKLLGRASGEYEARYRAEHCGMEVFITAHGIPSTVPPAVITISDGFTCMVCHTPLALTLVEAATRLPAVIDLEFDDE